MSTRPLLLSALLFLTLNLTACAYVSQSEHTERVSASESSELEFGRIILSSKRLSQCAPVSTITATVPIKVGSSAPVKGIKYRWDDESDFVEAAYEAGVGAEFEELAIEILSPTSDETDCDGPCFMELTLVADLGDFGERELWSHPEFTMPAPDDGVTVAGSLFESPTVGWVDWKVVYDASRRARENEMGLKASYLASMRVAVGNTSLDMGQEAGEMVVSVAACPNSLAAYDSNYCVDVAATVVDEENRAWSGGDVEFAVELDPFAEAACADGSRDILWQWYLVVENDLCQGNIQRRVSDLAFRFVEDDCDGDAAVEDCNDDDPLIYVGATDLPDDGIDQDCSGYDRLSCFEDLDGDGFGDDSAPGYSDEQSCANANMSAVGGDCNDNNRDSCPGCVERPDDGLDGDCDGADSTMCSVDQDGDGFGSEWATVYSPDDDCSSPGESTSDSDCDDSTADLAPGRSEIVDDGIDQDCNGFDKLTCFDDADSDGYGDLENSYFGHNGPCAQSGGSENSYDCDDSDEDVNPAILEVCDGIDNDCDSATDESGLISVDNNSYTSINDAIDAAPGGWSTVQLCSGTYVEDVVIDREITLEGVLGQDETIIKPETSGHATVVVTSPNVILRGLTISGGEGLGDVDDFTLGGGGIHAESAPGMIIEESTISDNSAGTCGGAIFSEFVEIRSVQVHDNSADVYGGGLCLQDGVLDDVSIFSNFGELGAGGFVVVGSVTIRDSYVYLNSTDGEAAGGVLVVETGILTSVNTEWGSSSQDNSPDDIYIFIEGEDGGSGTNATYLYGDSAPDFVCTNAECL